MNERSNKVHMPRLDEKRLLDINELCLYLSMGRTNLFSLAKNEGWLIKVGSKNLYDRHKVDKWCDEQTQDA